MRDRTEPMQKVVPEEVGTLASSVMTDEMLRGFESALIQVSTALDALDSEDLDRAEMLAACHDDSKGDASDAED